MQVLYVYTYTNIHIHTHTNTRIPASTRKSIRLTMHALTLSYPSISSVLIDLESTDAITYNLAVRELGTRN